MNNKGFTMIELLAIITVLVTILLVSFPTLINMTRRDKERQYNDLVATLCKAGETYIYDNPDVYSDIGTEGTITYVDLDELIDDNLINGEQINPKTGNKLFGNIKYTTEADKSLKCDYAEDMPITNMLIENKDSGSTFLNTGIESDRISNLSIHNTINIPSGYEQKDCSYLQDESVMCYWKESEGDLDMHISANGDVYTPYNSSYLFSKVGLYNNQENMIEMNFLGLNTKFTLIMKRMFDTFAFEGHVTKLDLGDKFDTSNVEDMSYMFNQAGIKNLNKLNLGNKFDTSKVTNMSHMFSSLGNYRLDEINLGDKFDTSNVEDMSCMFMGVGGKLQLLDLGDKFNTSNVKDMSAMFYKIGTSSAANSNRTASIPFTLKLGKKFAVSDKTNTSSIFRDFASIRNTISIIVGNEDIKNKILSLTDAEIPQRVIDNNLITVE